MIDNLSKKKGREDYHAGREQHPKNLMRSAGWLEAAMANPESFMNKHDKDLLWEATQSVSPKRKRNPKIQRTWKGKRPMGRAGEKRNKTKEELK